MVIVDINHGREIKRQEISLENLTLAQRLEIFTRWGVRKIICAGVSEVMCRFLSGSRIALISGVAGDIEKIINAYLCNHLDDACFVMPGKSSKDH
jgi:hypothetical protein